MEQIARRAFGTEDVKTFQLFRFAIFQEKLCHASGRDPKGIGEAPIPASRLIKSLSEAAGAQDASSNYKLKP